MKSRTRRLLSVFLAASMVMGHGNLAALAEETTQATETVERAAAEEPSEKPTEAPAEAKTEAPTEAPTEAKTEAPTEAPTEAKTEAPTEALTEAKTEAPTEAATEARTETVTETNAEESGETSAETPAEPATETAVQNDTEAATEAKKDTFVWSKDGLNVKVKLSAKDALPESAQMTVTALTKKSEKEKWKKAEELLKKETNQGHRELTAAYFYEITFTVNGQPVELSEKAEVTLTYEKALSLQLSEYAQPEANVFVITEDAAKESGKAVLNDSWNVQKAEVSVKNSLLVAVAGIQNRKNDGEQITQSRLDDILKEAQQYAVVANEYSGSMKTEVAAANLMEADEEEKPQADPSQILDSLKKASLILANGTSSKQVKVVNLYTDENGTINTEPLEEVLTEGRLDVTDTTLVINLVAGAADQDLKIPVYEAQDQDGQEEAVLAGRIIYNFAAEDGEELVSYLGEAQLEGEAAGIYLAPEASVKSEKTVTGAVYADQVSISNVEKMVTEAENEAVTEAAETESEAITEAVTEAAETESEAVTETVTEAAEIESEAITEVVTEIAETESEAITEAVTESAETESEAITEAVTEAAEIESEAVTEAITEAAETESEAITEAVTEAVETESEVMTEQTLIEETELETELVMEEEAEEAAALALAAQAAKTDSFLVKKVAKTADHTQEVPLKGAVLTLSAAEDVAALSEITVKDKDGNDKKFEKDAVVYSRGTVIYSWTTDEQGTAVDLASYLVPGGKYLLRETVTPDGYMKSNDITFLVDKDGKVKYQEEDSETIRELTLVNYPIAAAGEDTQILALKLAVQEGEKNTAETGNAPVYLDGAEFVIKNEKGEPLTDGNGNPYTFSTEAKIMTMNLDPAMYPALTDSLADGEQRTFTIVQIQAKSGYQISEYAQAQIVVQKDNEGKVTLILQENAVNADGVLVFYNKKITGAAAGSITVTKRNYLGDTENQIYSKTGGTYYAALFSDADKTIRVSDIKQIRIKTGYKSASVLFEDLPNGTYYVGETDAYGNLLGEDTDGKTAKDPFYAEYEYGANRKNVTIKVDADAQFDADAESVTIENHYFSMPDGFVYTAAFQATLQLKQEDGSAYSSKNTYYANIYTKSTKNGTYSYIGKKAIKMGGKSEKTITVELTMSTQTKYIKVQVTDAKGNAVGTEKELVLKQGDTETKSVVITAVISADTNETESETQSTVDPNNMKAELKLTKKVTYKNTAIRVNNVYYIGIFDDADLTKLRYKKAMTFTNASELTATLKVNLHKLASREVTFYFAEVDENGQVVKSGKEFGYEISINKTSITLNADNMEDEVILTNNVYEGSSVSQQLTDPSSGLAGDSAALASAQNLAASGNSSENTQTGDDNPILLLLIVLAVSAVVIFAVIVFLIRRNRNQRQGRRRR